MSSVGMALTAEKFAVRVSNTFIEVVVHPSCDSCARQRSQTMPALRIDALLAGDVEAGNMHVHPLPSKDFKDFVDSSTDACTDDSESEESESGCSTDMCTRVEVPVSKAQVVSPEGAPPQPASIAERTPLNAKAAIWKPTAMNDRQGTMSTQSMFRASIALLVQEVASKVQQSRLCWGVESLWHGGSAATGCTLKAYIGPKHTRSSKRLANAAKEAIVRHTFQSRGVQLVGAKKAPFVPTAQGFVAMLGSAPEKGEACRYECGSHSTASLSFVIALAEPEHCSFAA